MHACGVPHGTLTVHKGNNIICCAASDVFVCLKTAQVNVAPCTAVALAKSHVVCAKHAVSSLETPLYNANVNAETVTLHEIRSTLTPRSLFLSFMLLFSPQIRRPTPAKVHTYFKLTEGATYDEKASQRKYTRFIFCLHTSKCSSGTAGLLINTTFGIVGVVFGVCWWLWPVVTSRERPQPALVNNTSDQ